MQALKLFLYPVLILIQVLYYIIISLRNILYDYKVLTENKFKINIISIGSLKFGGALGLSLPCKHSLGEELE